MSEKEALQPGAPPPSYNQAVGGGEGYGTTPGPGHRGYAPTPGVPSYAAQPGYNTNYGQNVIRQPGYYGGQMVDIPDHMGLAILATVCCCWPIGIIAILRAQDARRSAMRGDTAGALMQSSQAKRYALIAIGFGAFIVVFVIVVAAVVVTAGN